MEPYRRKPTGSRESLSVAARSAIKTKAAVNLAAPFLVAFLAELTAHGSVIGDTVPPTSFAALEIVALLTTA